MRLCSALRRDWTPNALTFFCLVMALSPRGAAARPFFYTECRVEAGGLLGLDEPLRGGKAGLALSFPEIPLSPALRLALVGDRALSAWLFEPSLALGLGEDLALFAGLVHPLSDVGMGLESGRRLRLAVPGLPSLFGFEARVVKRRLSRSLVISVVADLEWIAWRIVLSEADEDMPGYYASSDSLRAFSEGFSASLLVRLDLGLGPR